MKQNEFFDLTGRIREDFIAEAVGWQHKDAEGRAAAPAKGEGTVSRRPEMTATRLDAVRADRRAGWMAAGGVAIAAAFALTVGVVMHSAGNEARSSQTAMEGSAETTTGDPAYITTEYVEDTNSIIETTEAPAETEAAVVTNMFGGKGTLRFLTQNDCLAEDDERFYSSSFSSRVYGDKTAPNADGSYSLCMSPVGDAGFDEFSYHLNADGSYSLCMSRDGNVGYHAFSYYTASLDGSVLYSHEDEGHTHIYARDANGNEYEPFAEQIAICTSEFGGYYISRLKQIGDTDFYWIEMYYSEDDRANDPFAFDKETGSIQASGLMWGIFNRNDKVHVAGECATFRSFSHKPYDLEDNACYCMSYDPVTETIAVYNDCWNESNPVRTVGLMSLTDLTSQESYPMSLFSTEVEGEQRTTLYNLTLWNGKGYFTGADNAFYEFDFATQTKRMLRADFRYGSATLMNGKIYAVSEEKNIICCDLDGSNEETVYDGGDALHIIEFGPDAVRVELDHEGEELVLDRDQLFILADGRQIHFKTK